MKTKIVLGVFAFLGLLGFSLGSTTQARELNSSNVESYCSTIATSCSFNGKGITSIAAGTFVNYSALRSLMLDDNQISSIEPGAFVGLSSLRNLDLDNNQISGIESGAFLGLSSLTQLNLSNNYLTTLPEEVMKYTIDTFYFANDCFSHDLLTEEQNNYLDATRGYGSGDGRWENRQQVCPMIEYTPSTETTGSVIGKITLIGGLSGQREALYAVNPTITDLTHTWTGNGIFGFDLSTLVDTGYYLKITRSYNSETLNRDNITALTGKVDRIIPYVAPVEPTKPTKPTVGFAGGGGSSSVWTTPTTPINPANPITPTTPTTPTTPSGTEQTNAYKRAYNAGVTTQPTVGQARLENTISRGELAKMLAVYAKEQLKKTPDTTKACTYTDANTTSSELAGYMKEVCQLGIMGLQGDGKTPLEMFNPNETVTRAQLVTTISRLLYGNKYDTNTADRWRGHMNILKADGIITITDPAIVELRGWVILMLYRLQ